MNLPIAKIRQTESNYKSAKPINSTKVYDSLDLVVELSLKFTSPCCSFKALLTKSDLHNYSHHSTDKGKPNIIDFYINYTPT